MDPDPCGIIWWPVIGGEVALVVAGGRVVDCPPYMRSQGCDARTVWREARARGVELTWLSTSTPAQRFQPYLMFGKVVLRRWAHPGDIPQERHLVTFGRLADGRWFVDDTGGEALAYGDEADGWADIRRRLRDVRWVRVPVDPGVDDPDYEPPG